MNDNGTETKQEQPCSQIIRFRVLKLSGLTTAPHPTKEVGNLPPDSKGNVIYETEDIEWFETHRDRGELEELLDAGGVDGDKKISVKTGAVEGDETTFIMKIWNVGKEYSVPIPDKDILSLQKVRAKVFGVSGFMLPKMTNEEWQSECKNLYADARRRNDVSVTEFHELPLVLDFINYIEGATPVLDKNDLSLERGNVVWYDAASNQIRPLRKHFDDLITTTPGMTASRYAKLIKSLRIRDSDGNLLEADQVHLGKENKKYAYWIVNPEMFPNFMGRVRTLLSEGKGGD